MKNFDTERESRRSTLEERTFQLGGETFVCRAAVRPEALAQFDDITDDTPVKQSMEALDNLIKALIEPDEDAHGRYDAIRLREDDPLTADDLREVVEWLVETNTGRPPTSPSASGAGRGPRGTRSTADSSYKAIPA